MKVNILLAEDESNVRRSISHFINQLGSPYHLIGSAANGEDAWEMIKNHHVHILITDIRMPKLDGLELVGRIKNTAPYCKVIIISGYDDFEYARKAIQLGVNEYLLKPINENTLAQTLVNVTAMYFSIPKDMQLLVNQEKWDMELTRLESSLFDAIEMGNKKATVESFTKLYSGFLNRVDDDLIRLISFVIDSIKSLRKRLSTIDTAQKYFDKESNRMIRELNPRMTSTEIRNKVQDFFIYCAVTVSSCRQQPCPDIVFQSKEIIHNYFDNHDITLNEVADMIGVTPSYLSRVFKKENQINFTEYLNQVRIENAKSLLKNPYLKIIEISEKVGFNNPEYFTRTFKRYTGTTPQNFRSRVLK